MREVNRAGFFIFLIKREINNPTKTESAFFYQIQFFAEFGANLTGKFIDKFFIAAHKDNRITIFKAEIVFKFCHFFFREEFSNTFRAAR